MIDFNHLQWIINCRSYNITYSKWVVIILFMRSI